jgi:hypothetical protein
MTWTTDPPGALGWYWFKHPNLNFGHAMPAWVYNADRIARVKLMAVHGEPQDKNLDDCAGEWSEAIEVPGELPRLELPERIKNRMTRLKREVEQIIDGAFSILTTELPGPVQFEYVNAAPRDVLTDDERAQSFSFVTRYDHLPGECRLTAIEHDGRWDIENIDYLRHALNEFRPLIQNQNDWVHYQKIHKVWCGMLKLEDSTRGTTIRVFDTTGTDVTENFIRWLGEANKAIRYVLGRLEYGYLYNGILQHSDSEYSARFVEDYTSGELNYILWKHALILDFIKDMLGRYYPVIKHLSYLRPGSL